MVRRIEKLCLEHFRGATCPVEIEFDTSKPAVMIFGENGTGKSTIIDSIDFVCNENIGSLMERSSTRASHLPSLNYQASDLKVTMSCDGAEWIAILSGRNPSVSGPDDRPIARILRRTKILDLINAEPRKRYEVIQAFIEVPGIQSSENALREAIRNADRELNMAIQAQQQATEALEGFWKDEGSKGKDHISWAIEESQKDSDELNYIALVLNNVLPAIGHAINVRTRLTTALTHHDTSEKARKTAEEALEKAVERLGDPNVKGSLITTLQDAKKYLDETDSVENCPVCQTTVKTEELKQDIQRRLDSFNELVGLKKALDDAQRTTASKVTLVLQAKTDLLNSMKALAASVKDCGIKKIQELGIEWKRLEVDPSNATQSEEILKLSHEALDLIAACEDALKGDHKEITKSLTQLSSIKRHLKTVEEKTKAALDLNNLLQKLNAMLQIVEKERKEYVDGVLTSISETIEELYSKVHPNENLGNIRFYLDPRYQGSLLFDGSFEGADEIPPQAYYSESHLDTLGVCVFLALAKYFNDGNTIVVLDDVVTSVDQAHMNRFMNLLHDESVNFNQLIIATHYRPWRDRYRYARGPAGNIQLIELLHWSLPRGIRHTKTKLSVEELQHHTQQEPLDRQIVSSKAGILLESLLDHLALMYECKISRKAEPYYTLGELTDCIGRRLRTALKSEFIADDGSSIERETQLGPIITKIAEMSWIRNQVGCHWNISGLDVSDSDIQEFFEVTIELANALVCENCGQLPLRDRTGSYFECRCHRKRLHPVNNPD
jgi:energy-coupling factor transporter ATP-binding protein EcfA2